MALGGAVPVRSVISYDVPLLPLALRLQGPYRAVRASRAARSVRVSAVAAPQQVRDPERMHQTIRSGTLPDWTASIHVDMRAVC